MLLDKELSNFNNIIEMIDLEIAYATSNDSGVEILIGFTGIDFYTAMVLIYETGSITRFGNPKKLVGWVCLLHPCINRER